MKHSVSTVDQLKTRDPDAWAEFFREHHQAVWLLVRHRVQNDQQAEDIVSETFMAALQSIETYEPEKNSAEQWFYGIVRHKLADHLRQMYRSKHIQPIQPHLALTAPTPSDTTDLASMVDHALAQLPCRHREVLLWMYQDHLSVREVAHRINRTEKAVENLLYRARQRFKGIYQSLLDESPSYEKHRRTHAGCSPDQAICKVRPTS